jgi:hypothetical protein
MTARNLPAAWLLRSCLVAGLDKVDCRFVTQCKKNTLALPRFRKPDVRMGIGRLRAWLVIPIGKTWNMALSSDSSSFDR